MVLGSFMKINSKLKSKFDVFNKKASYNMPQFANLVDIYPLQSTLQKWFADKSAFPNQDLEFDYEGETFQLSLSVFKNESWNEIDYDNGGHCDVKYNLTINYLGLTADFNVIYPYKGLIPESYNRVDFAYHVAETLKCCVFKCRCCNRLFHEPRSSRRDNLLSDILCLDCGLEVKEIKRSNDKTHHRMNKTVVCVACNLYYSKRSMRAHYKSKKHLKNLDIYMTTK